jgi:hypothetical protein
MAPDAPDEAGGAPADRPPPQPCPDEVGLPAVDAAPDVPDLPLFVVLRRTARSSLLGFVIGLAVVLATLPLGWADNIAGVAGLASYGMPPIRRERRLPMVLAFTITTGACLVVGVLLLGDRLPPPWDLFIPLTLALAVGSQMGSTAAYIRRPTAATDDTRVAPASSGS